jgi:maleamate amidohydrolase
MSDDFKDLWLPLLSEQDKAILETSHYGQHLPWPTDPALVVIDMTYDFCGSPGLNAVAAARERRTACGPNAWTRVPAIANIIAAARQARIPIAYSRRSDVRLRRQSPKTARAHEDVMAFSAIEDGNSIIAELAPEPHDLVFGKTSPSIFFDTAFGAWYEDNQCDGLFVVGCTTSGCVRASVVDAFSRQINCFIIADAVFDRFSLSHRTALFDCQAKYADLVSAATFVRQTMG